MELDFTSLKKEYDLYENEYLAIFKETLKILKIKCSPIVSVALIGDKEIREINKTYRKVDRPTDVISFAFLDDEENLQKILFKKQKVVLGDIYISYDRAKEQAETYGHSERREFLFLFVHGLLHLLGYNHMEEEDENKMFDIQETILKSHEVKTMKKEKLIEQALKARELSRSPYSKFAVGAALLCKDGEVFLGANIENASYSLCMCAERNAIYNAMMHGKKKEDFESMALIADTEGPCSPCGACRQVISELLPSSTPIHMANLKGEVKTTNPEELLPFAFDSDDLEKR